MQKKIEKITKREKGEEAFCDTGEMTEEEGFYISAEIHSHFLLLSLPLLLFLCRLSGSTLHTLLNVVAEDI